MVYHKTRQLTLFLSVTNSVINTWNSLRYYIVTASSICSISRFKINMNGFDFSNFLLFFNPRKLINTDVSSPYWQSLLAVIYIVLFLCHETKTNKDRTRIRQTDVLQETRTHTHTTHTHIYNNYIYIYIYIYIYRNISGESPYLYGAVV